MAAREGVRVNVVSSAPPTRVLILGGTGFLGSSIARAYLRAGSDVTLLSRRPDALAPSVGSRVARVLLAPPHDMETLAGAVAGAEHVVHALGSMNPAEAERDPSGVAHSMPTLIRILEQVRAGRGVGLTFLSSGGAVYGEGRGHAVSESSECRPLSSYGAGKLTAESHVAMYVARYGIAARILRVGNAYGPGQQLGRGQGLIATVVDAAVSGSTVRVYGDGTHVRDYVHVDDVATAVVALSRLTGGPMIVNVGTGVGHDIHDVVRLVERVSGATLDLRFLPGRDFDVRHNVLDVTRLRSLIDWTATPLPVGIEATYSAHAQLASPAVQVRSA